MNISPLLEKAYFNDPAYARNEGFGIGDINRKLDIGLQGATKVVYR